jgi:hypothetical protein
MRQVYSPANVAEAHMLADLLAGEGIVAHVHGAALQGAVGDLPAGNLIQLMVADEDYDRARALLMQWERASSPEEPVAQPGKRFRFVAALVFLLVGAFIGWSVKVGLDNSRFTIGETTVALDQNRDGRDDVTWFYRFGSTNAYRAEFDSNHDGRADFIANYDEVGTPTEESSDDNFDGLFETRSIFRGGIRQRTEIDTDANRVPDTILHYEHGIVRREEITDHRYGWVVRINHYADLRLERSEIDLDRNRSLETVRVYDAFGEVVSETRAVEPR